MRGIRVKILCKDKDTKYPSLRRLTKKLYIRSRNNNGKTIIKKRENERKNSSNS